MSDMVTFSLEAGSCNNFYRGHEPHNRFSNCWGDEDSALVLSIEQARALAAAWHGNRMKIVISLKTDILTTQDFERELFCAAGGEWFVFPHRTRLAAMLKCDHHQHGNRCKYCGARWTEDHGGYWYDGTTGRELCEELKV